MTMRELLGTHRVLPVLELRSVEEALAVGRLLLDAGITLIEVTLRTPVALDCIRALAREYPQACVGAGTVLDATQIAAVREAGARFGVSPGLTPALSDAIRAVDFPFLPGVATVSEMLRAREAGFRLLKFFPAELAGGPALLRSVQNVLPDLDFCATGGVHAANLDGYLALRNVAAVGGSWMLVRDVAGRLDPESTHSIQRELPERTR